MRNGELDWVYPEELDLHTAYWWSPDSSHIAFLQLDESPVEKYPLADLLSHEGGLTEERYPRRRLAQSRRARRASCRSPAANRPLDGYRRGRHRAAGARRLAARFAPRGHRASQPRAKSPRSAFRRRRHRKIADRARRAGPLLDQRQRRPIFFRRWPAVPVVQRALRLPPPLSIRPCGQAVRAAHPRRLGSRARRRRGREKRPGLLHLDGKKPHRAASSTARRSSGGDDPVALHRTSTAPTKSISRPTSAIFSTPIPRP